MMKKIWVLMVMLVLIGGCKPEIFIQRYNKGDIVYMKPDSTQAEVHGIIRKKQIIELGVNVVPGNYYILKFVDENRKTTYRWINDKKVY